MEPENLTFSLLSLFAGGVSIRNQRSARLVRAKRRATKAWLASVTTRVARNQASGNGAGSSHILPLYFYVSI